MYACIPFASLAFINNQANSQEKQTAKMPAIDNPIIPDVPTDAISLT